MAGAIRRAATVGDRDIEWVETSYRSANVPIASGLSAVAAAMF